MPSINIHTKNNCRTKYVGQRKNEMNNILVKIDRNISPFLPDSLNAKTINVKDSAITIKRICNVAGRNIHNYSRA